MKHSINFLERLIGELYYDAKYNQLTPRRWKNKFMKLVYGITPITKKRRG